MVAAAASTVMDKIHSTLIIKEVKDIFKEEWVDMLGVVSEGEVEAEVVYVKATVELEEVEVTLEEMVEGGGSFNKGTNQKNECCFNLYEHGRVIITFLQ